jgi:hypothetical protein
VRVNLIRTIALDNQLNPTALVIIVFAVGSSLLIVQ